MTTEVQKTESSTQQKTKSDETLIKEAKKRIQRLKTRKTLKKGKPSRKQVIKRGVVYLGHIPYGFFEKEIKSYFEQFGRVLGVKLSRSPKTGKSKGYAFIEFQDDDVAKIVAETMNNYLMFERLLKAEYIPPEKVHPKLFPPVRFIGKDYPTLKRREALKRIQDNPVTDEQRKSNRKRISHRVKVALSKLKAMGIEYTPQIYDPEKNANVNAVVEPIASTGTLAAKKPLEKSSSKSPVIKTVEKPTPKSLMKQSKKIETVAPIAVKAAAEAKNFPKVNVTEDAENGLEKSTTSSKAGKQGAKSSKKVKPNSIKTPSKPVTTSKIETSVNGNSRSTVTKSPSEKEGKTAENTNDSLTESNGTLAAKIGQKKRMKANKQSKNQNPKVVSIPDATPVSEKTENNSKLSLKSSQQATPKPVILKTEIPPSESKNTKSMKRSRSDVSAGNITASTAGQQQKTPKSVKKQKTDQINQEDAKTTPTGNILNLNKKKLATPKPEEPPKDEVVVPKKTPKSKSGNLSVAQDSAITPRPTATPKIGKAVKKETPKPSPVLKTVQTSKKETPKPSPVLKAVQSAKKETPKSANTPKLGKSSKKETPRLTLASKVLKNVKTDTPKSAVSQKVNGSSKKQTPKSTSKSFGKSKKFGTPL